MVPIIEITSHSQESFNPGSAKEIKTSNQTIKKDIGELNEEIAGIAKIIQKTNILNLKFMILIFLMRSCKEN